MSSIALLLALCAPVSLPSSPAPQPQKTAAINTNPQTAPSPGISVLWAGLDAALTDPKDAGLLAALKVADERILQLTEMPGWDGPPAPAMAFLFDLLGSPLTLSVAPADGAQGAPIGARLEVSGDADEVRALAEHLGQLLRMGMGEAGQPDASQPGFMLLDTPGGPLRYGISAQAPPRLVVTFGDAPAAAAMAPLVEGSRVLAMDCDFKKLQPLFEVVLEESGSQADDLRELFSTVGIMGENALRGRIDTSHGPELGHLIARWDHIAGLMENLGMGNQEPLSQADLTRIPQGATFAQIARSEPLSFVKSFEFAAQLEGGQGDDFLALFRDETGLDLKSDLLEPLGDVLGLYLAPEAGGGLLSAVMFASVDDAETLVQSLTSLSEQAARPLAREMDGHMRIEAWQPSELENAYGWRIVFPQLPIPVQPALLISDGWLYASLYPSSTLTAAQQGRGASTSILDSERFVKALKTVPRSEFVSLQYSDTRAELEHSYSLLRLAGKSLDNLLLLPDGPGASEGMSVVPPFGELVPNTEPSLLLSYWDGEDLISEGTLDNSLVANCGGITGSYMALVMGIGLASTVATPMMMRGASQPYATPVQTEGDLFVGALQRYYVEHDETWPQAAEDLLQPSANGEPYLYVLPTDGWGRPFVHIAPTEEGAWPSVLSLGADGVEGGFGENEDIYIF